MAAAGAGAALAIDVLECEQFGGIGIFGMSGIVLTVLGLFVGALEANPLVLLSVWLIYLVAGALFGIRNMLKRSE
jgi:hypothetical protein